LVPSPLSNLEAKVKGPSKYPLPTTILPSPFLKPPFQIAEDFLTIAIGVYCKGDFHSPDAGFIAIKTDAN
jgi:hypothetical protein